MGIDVEDIKLCVCRIVQFSLRVSHRFVQKHPYVSGTLSLFFILYIFLPYVLRFLFYSLPFLGFTVILLAIWTSKSSTIHAEKGKDESESSENGGVLNRNRSAYLRNATSRRRRFREKSEAWNAEASIDVSAGKRDQPIESDNSKAFVEVKERDSFDYENNSSVNSVSADKNIEVSGQKHPILGSDLLVKSDLLGLEGSRSQTNKYDSGGDEMKIESSSEGEDEDEEEAQEDRNKVVEWTEDDQKNLMDLGLSEIERNRRLESLIARRRARKSYKRKVEARLSVDIIPPCQIAKIVTTKNDPLNVLNGSKEMEGGVPIPGSAPSILLPMRNPFDLPYDPHEEKPNLMADSFQQEFTAAHLKELSYCRHESFCLGPSFPLEDEGGGMTYPRFRRPSDKGDHDWLIEQLLFKDDQVSHAGGIGNSIQIKDDMDTTMALSMTDINGMGIESAGGKEIIPNTESELEPKLMQDSNDESSASSSSENPEDVICVNRGVVSETRESKVSNALNPSLNCLIPKSRLMKEPLCDFSPSAFEKNKIEDCFSYPDKVVCHTPTYSIASDMQVEVSEIGSPPLTVDGDNSHTDGEFLSHDWETEKDMNSGGEELWGTSSDLSTVKEKELNLRDVHEANEDNINNVEVLEIDMTSENIERGDMHSLLEEVPHKSVSVSLEVNLAGEGKASGLPDASAPEAMQCATQPTEELVDQPSYCVLPQEPEESSNPLNDNGKDSSHVMDQKDADVDADALDNMENRMKTSENIDGGFEILMKQEDDEKKTRLLEAEETNMECRTYFNDDSKDVSSHSSDLDQVQSQEEYNNLDQIADNGDLVEPNVQGSNTDRLMPSQTKEQLEFIKDGENQINVAETEIPNSYDAVKLTVDQDLVIEGDPLIVQQLEDTTTQPSSTNNVENSQELPKPLETYEEEAHAINNLNESIIVSKTEGENLECNESNRGESQISIIEDCIISPMVPVEDSIINDDKPKTIEEEDNKTFDSIEVENDGDKFNLDTKSHCEYTDKNLSTPNLVLDTDMNISENIAEGEVITNPQVESPVTEVQIETELAPAVSTNNNIESVRNCEDEHETQRFNNQESKLDESNAAGEANAELDIDMEGDSKSLNENEAVVSPSKQEGEISNSKRLKDGEEERNVVSLQTPGSIHENVELKEGLSNNSEK